MAPTADETGCASTRAPRTRSSPEPCWRARRRSASSSIGDPAVAIGRVVVTGEWAGVAAVEVVPERRREGLARRIVDTALAWAVERGADKAYLQTMRDNTAALALYAPYGFVDHHEYRYLRAADALVSRHELRRPDSD